MPYKYEPNRLEDIIVLVALYRPGPMSNIQFIMIVNMVKKARLSSSKIRQIKTYIWSDIHQEQGKLTSSSGFTAGEADISRRAMGKKKIRAGKETKILRIILIMVLAKI